MKDPIGHAVCPKCGEAIPAEAAQGVCPKCLLSAVATPTETGQSTENRPPPPPVDVVQAALTHLEVLELIGCGGMGAVYRARQPKLDRTVALKLLMPPLASDAAFAERFHREARLLARLNHPGVVSVFDYGEANGLFYLVMEYVDGANIRQAMQAGRFTPVQALALVPRICEALQYAHDEGILHRDIKPENILLDVRGRVKIADFGIAKVVGTQSSEGNLTVSGTTMGTPHYMAPEQLETPQDVDQRADIYSLGVVFYEMLTGELPIGHFARPSQKTQVDPRVDEVVLRALARDRERRQRSATEVKQQVEQITATARHRTESDPQVGTEAQSGIAPKTSLCFVSTPEYLRTFRGRFFYIYQGEGELRLEGQVLSFHSGWQVATIPLSSIRSLSLGQYPASAKPVPLQYIGVTFEEFGVSRTLLFTPASSALRPAWQTNEVVAEWLSALQHAIRMTTGCAIEIDRSNHASGWSWKEMGKTYLLTAAGCTLAFALAPVIVERRLPDRLSDLIWGPVTAVLTLLLLMIVRAWRQRSGRLVEQRNLSFAPQRSGRAGADQRSQKRSECADEAARSVPGGYRRAVCYFSTPERMRDCFPAPEARIFKCKGQLRLDTRDLIFVSPWRTEVRIALDAIANLSIGHFEMWTTPWVMKYERVNFLSVTFREGDDRMRAVHLTPVATSGARSDEWRTTEGEWFDSIKSAVVAHVGQAPQASDPAAISVSAEPAWGRKGWPLFFASLLAVAGIGLIPATPALTALRAGFAVLTAVLWAATLAFCIGFLRANAALKRGDLDAVTSDEPPEERPWPVSAAWPLPLSYLLSAWLFVIIGGIAVVDTVASLYVRPFRGAFYPGVAHLVAGIALLRLSWRWRTAALVVLSVALAIGGLIGVLSVIRPENATVSFPWLGADLNVTEEPRVAAAGMVFLAAVLLWPAWLLLSPRARRLFGGKR